MDEYETVQKPEFEYILGDADGDGKVTVLDATAIQRYLAGLTVSNPTAVTLSGDIIGDGLDITDATAIQRFLVGYPIAYEIGKQIE